jgi:2-methylcitrate synthase/citrate synthase II
MSETNPNYSPGLEGVIAGMSGLSQIDFENNILTYRGYNVQDLCDHASFEEVAYLLYNGELPAPSQLAQFQASLDNERAVPDAVYNVLRQLPADSEPMDWLKIAVATVVLFDPQASENGHEANVAKALRLTAKMPALVANGWRVIHGQSPTSPKPGLSTSAQFFYLLNGKEADEFFVKTLNTTLILYAEHGFNASTFTARVTVSTLSDLHSGVVSAIGALKGSLHGGANEEVMHMLLEIGDPANAEEWVRKRLTKTLDNPRPRIMGFGHREYKKGDQRAQIVRQYTRELGRRLGDTRWSEISDTLEKYMLEEKGLYPNLDFPVSPAYYLMGLPIPLYTPIFVVSRVVGWCGHIIEQLDNNRIIRPTNIYNGPNRRDFLPLERRG